MDIQPKFCSVCGAPTDMRIPPGDDHLRAVCTNCPHISYINPKVIVGTIYHNDRQVLLCKRAIEPRLGAWTIPAGFMENSETTRAGAVREAFEEALAKPVGEPQLYANYSLPRISQVYQIYRAQLRDNQHSPGIESLETKLVNFSDIDEYDLAFGVIRHALALFVADLKQGSIPVHDAAIGGSFDQIDVIYHHRLSAD